MGRKYDGIIIHDRWEEKGAHVGKRWRVRVRNGVGRYTSKAFSDEEEATRWAKAKRARYVAGVELGGRVDAAVVVEDLLADLERRKRSPGHLAEMKRILEGAVKAGCKDLAEPRIAEKAKAFLAAQVDANPKRGKDKPAVPITERTRNRFLSHLRHLGNYAVDEGIIGRNPFRTVKKAAVEEKLKATYSVGELRTMLADEHREKRFWLLAAVMAYTGMRAGEARHLRWEAIDWVGRRIAIKLDASYRIKRSKERTTPLLDELRDILHPIAKPHGYVFEDPKLRDPDRKTAMHQLRRFLKDVEIADGDRDQHSFRHTWCAAMLATGCSLKRVQRWMGHSNIETTAGYADAEEAFSDAVPGWERGQFYLRRPSPATARTPAAAAASPSPTTGAS